MENGMRHGEGTLKLALVDINIKKTIFYKKQVSIQINNKNFNILVNGKMIKKKVMDNLNMIQVI